jgi:hypothetical protein
VRLEGLGQLKNPMTSSRIEPATFRLVAECLNQLRYAERIPGFAFVQTLHNISEKQLIPNSFEIHLRRLDFRNNHNGK